MTIGILCAVMIYLMGHGIVAAVTLGDPVMWAAAFGPLAVIGLVWRWTRRWHS